MKRTGSTKPKKTSAGAAKSMPKKTQPKPAKRSQPSKVRSNFNPRGALGATSAY
jgi:hypothetical protein